ncbi:MAG: ATP-binding protein [bacterium]
MFLRAIQKEIEKQLFDGKIIVIYGARQVGKTTLLNILRKKLQNKSSLFFNCDEPDTRELFFNPTSTTLKSTFGSSEIIFIDEAQRIKNIGLTLKLAIDSMPEKQFIVTGSSSFDLSNKINEPLTGRKYEFYLYPLALEELTFSYTQQENQRLLPQRIIFGMYPDVINKPHKAEFILKNLIQGALYKDILEHQTIKHSEFLEKLLKALAFQIGQEVSYNELSDTLKINKATVERYIRLLEQSFIIFTLTPFSRNLRTELKKMHKIYFYDNGVRNAIISAFGNVDLRNDIGALWENFLISERIKYLNNHSNLVNRYFWRTHSQQEIDYLEEKNLKISAFEFKWKNKKAIHAPKSFDTAYPNTPFSIITPENYQNFVGIKNSI